MTWSGGSVSPKSWPVLSPETPNNIRKSTQVAILISRSSHFQLLYAFSFKKSEPNKTELGGFSGPSSNVNAQSMAVPSGDLLYEKCRGRVMVRHIRRDEDSC